MSKADLMDELRSQIGMCADRCEGNMENLYNSVCQAMVEHVQSYRCVCIYIAKTNHFCKQASAGGDDGLPDEVNFGHGLWSIAAVRGGLVYDRLDDQAHVIVPFYRGHHLIGELVVIGNSQEQLDDEDISFFYELASLFETKVKEYNS